MLTDHFHIIPAHGPETSSIVASHGLNVKPEAMGEITRVLSDSGACVFLVRLSGHYDSGIKLKHVELSHWEDEFLDTYHQAERFAKKRKLPLHFVGYSMGCLLAQFLVLKKALHFERKVFLAPATNLSMASRLVSFLFFVPPNVALPSFTPRTIRANSKLPLKFYKIMFGMEKTLRTHRYENLNTPTLIIADPKDELISFKQIKGDKDRFQLTEFEILTLESDLNGRDTRYHHLILTEKNTGSANWLRMKKKIIEFLFY